MIEKTTKELEEILMKTHAKDASSYLDDNWEALYTEDNAFAKYMAETIKSKNLKKQRIFIEADIPERYGYKLLSGEKTTRQRDVILRICYAAHFSVEETQQALKIYQMPLLYPKLPRDALLMIAFNERPGSIIDVNTFLEENGVELLRSSGLQD